MGTRSIVTALKWGGTCHDGDHVSCRSAEMERVMIGDHVPCRSDEMGRVITGTMSLVVVLRWDVSL